MYEQHTYIHLVYFKFWSIAGFRAGLGTYIIRYVQENPSFFPYF